MDTSEKNTLVNLTEELNELFKNSILNFIDDEIKQSLSLVDKIKLQGNLSISLCREAIESDRRSIYFEENAKFNLSIRELVQGAYKEKPATDFYPIIRDFLLKSYRAISVHCENKPQRDKLEQIIGNEWIMPNYIHFIHSSFSGITSAVNHQRKVDTELSNHIKLTKQNNLEAFLFYFLIVENLNDISPLFDTILKLRIKLLKHFWNLEKEQQHGLLKIPSSEKIEEKDNQLDWFKNETEQEIAKEIEKQVNQFSAAYNQRIQDDLALSSYTSKNTVGKQNKMHFRLFSNLASDCDGVAKKYNKQFNNWHNTLFLLIDDWALNLEINGLRFQFQKDSIDFANHFSSQFEKPYKYKIEQLIECIKEDINSIEPIVKGNGKSSIEKLNLRRNELLKKLRIEKLPSIYNLFDEIHAPELIDRFQHSSEPRFSSISMLTQLMKNASYDESLNSKDFVSISPHKLIAYKMRPQFMLSFPRLKTAFINYFQQVRLSLEEIPGIANFTYVSGIRKLENGSDSTDAIQIIQEGLKRIELKTNSLLDFHQSFVEKEIMEFHNSFNKLCDGMNDIKENESALQVKFEVTKLKAIERSKAIRTNIFEKIRNLLPVIIQLFNRLFQFLKLSSKKIRIHLQVEKSKEFISSDISDYLISFTGTISKLPYVYQQLFSFEALSGQDFYFERVGPWDKLIQAYEKWKDKKYAPVVIVGEKGTGKTTLFYKFKDTIKGLEESVYIDLHSEEIPSDELYLKIKKIAEDGGSGKSSNSGKKVIIIDGLEKLFTLRIDGFDNIYKLIQLISATHQNIFWVFGCHLISWNYLNKTINMSDYFGYTIKLPELSATDLRKLIELRHNMSGFRMGFVNHQTKKSILNFKKLGEIELQETLKNEYFEHLKFAVKGNITQAFLYWLVSTVKIEETVIHFDWEKLPNNSFIKTLSKEKLLIFRVILIENGLSANELMEILHCDYENARMKLDQFYDDGLLIKSDDMYFVNPLIYRQVIDELYNINMLH